MYFRAERNIALAFLSGVQPDKIISSYTDGTWNTEDYRRGNQLSNHKVIEQGWLIGMYSDIVTI
jgi:hypothetical protein